MTTTVEQVIEVLNKVSTLTVACHESGGQSLDPAGVALAMDLVNLASHLDGEFVVGDGSSNVSCKWMSISEHGSHGGQR